jgi:hypothetical protein
MDQTFRYAALSSGLEIVRKALGGHEIAIVQITTIDKEAGLIRLTTTLAMRPGSGCRRNGRYAQSLRRRCRAAWERRSPTPDATPSLPSLESQERTISMRPRLARAATPIPIPVSIFKRR